MRMDSDGSRTRRVSRRRQNNTTGAKITARSYHKGTNRKATQKQHPKQKARRSNTESNTKSNNREQQQHQIHVDIKNIYYTTQNEICKRYADIVLLGQRCRVLSLCWSVPL